MIQPSLRELDTSWTLTLPTLAGLFPQPPSLLHRASLNPFFRSLTSLLATSGPPPLPSSSILRPICQFARSAQSPDPVKLSQALHQLGVYATQLLDAVKARGTNTDGENVHQLNDHADKTAVQEATGCMLLGFLHGAVACARFLEAIDTAVEPHDKMDDDGAATTRASLSSNVHIALRQCLEGTFILFPQLRSISCPPDKVWNAVKQVEYAILSSVFLESDDGVVPRHSFAPILRRARSITALLVQQRASRAAVRNTVYEKRNSIPLGGNRHLPLAGFSISEVASKQAHETLTTYAGCVAGLESLPVLIPSLFNQANRASPTTAESARRLPLRIALECRLLAADLALSMVTSTIAQVTNRAIEQLDTQGDCDERLTECGDTEVNGGDDNASDSDDDQVEWERLAETGLETCIVESTELVVRGRTAVLVDIPSKQRWLALGEGEGNATGVRIEANGGDTRQGDQSRWVDKDVEACDEGPDGPSSDHYYSDSAASEGDSVYDVDEAASDGDEDFGSGHDSEDDDDDDPADSGRRRRSATTFPIVTPLKMLFRLHDRYEESRLAVWMSLPTVGLGGVRRPKMTEFMRGTAGRVGDRWDDLGGALLPIEGEWKDGRVSESGMDVDSMLGGKTRSGTKSTASSRLSSVSFSSACCGPDQDYLTPAELLSHGLANEKLDRWLELHGPPDQLERRKKAKYERENRPRAKPTRATGAGARSGARTAARRDRLPRW